MTCRDEAVERVKRVTGLDHAIINTVFWALQPGDEIGGGLRVASYTDDEVEMLADDVADVAARQAAEEMRETICALHTSMASHLREMAQKTTNPIETGLLDAAARNLEEFEKRARSLPLPGDET